MNNLDITTSREGGVCRVSLVGEATIYHASDLKERLVEETGDGLHFELNLARVDEIDTAGLQVLLMLHRECQLHSKIFHLVQPSPSVKKLISLFGLEAHFDTSQPEASASVGGGEVAA